MMHLCGYMMYLSRRSLALFEKQKTVNTVIIKVGKEVQDDKCKRQCEVMAS
jgi:hypothetical protein